MSIICVPTLLAKSALEANHFAELKRRRQRFLKVGYANFQVNKEVEFEFDAIIVPGGVVLYWVQGTVYTVPTGKFIVVAGYPKEVGSEDEDLITNVYYLGK